MKKYILSAEERINKGGTMYFEFQKGTYGEVHWKDDSCYLYADYFDKFRLYEFFNDALSNFAYYGVTEVTKDEWQLIIKCAHDKGGIVEKLILELVPWADENYKNYDVFTILGI